MLSLGGLGFVFVSLADARVAEGLGRRVGVLRAPDLSELGIRDQARTLRRCIAQERGD